MKPPANRGFILFEALIAMTIVVGSGLGLVDIHHGLQARHLALQTNKTQLWAQASAYEMKMKVSTDYSVRPTVRSTARPTARPTKKSSSQFSSVRQKP
jgi:Tfp pilus assembly protein PilV